MSELKPFLDRLMAGHVLMQEIDDFVERWHGGDGTGELHEFLGMSLEEYTLWLRDPDALATICEARYMRLPIGSAMNDNAGSVRIAARSEAPPEHLVAWLRKTGRLE